MSERDDPEAGHPDVVQAVADFLADLVDASPEGEADPDAELDPD